jgi:small RNA 2'-O-methyltransferase
MTSWLHEERIEAVHAVVRARAPARLLDLGCGDGDLLVRLAAEPGPREIVGIDLCCASLARLRRRLALVDVRVPRIDLRVASMTDAAPDLSGFDCAVLVETIEHLAPDHLSRLERALFHGMRPGTVVITTPNAEFNPLLGVPPHRFRHPDHRFEWNRARFRQWCARAAASAGYRLTSTDIAGCHPMFGGASQMAVFDRLDLAAAPDAA